MVWIGLFCVLSFEATPSEFGLQNVVPCIICEFFGLIFNVRPKESINLTNPNPKRVVQTEKIPKIITMKTLKKIIIFLLISLMLNCSLSIAFRMSHSLH